MHAEGQRFESVILHNKRPEVRNRRYKPKRLEETKEIFDIMYIQEE